jgi:hypothetical protein
MKIAEPPKVRPRPEISRSELAVTAEIPASNDNIYKDRMALEPQLDHTTQLSTKTSEYFDPQELTDESISDFDAGDKKSLLSEILPDPG